MHLNSDALAICERLVSLADRLKVAVVEIGPARCIDCGVNVCGGLEAGRLLAEVCLSGRGSVHIAPALYVLGSDGWPGVSVVVRTDWPVAACLASQYAGWKISGTTPQKTSSAPESSGEFFAMGSGPMRAAKGSEPLFERIGFREKAEAVVGVLETSALPSEEICGRIAEECGVSPGRLTLLAARTASLAGTIQIAARSVETALHKLLELDFDMKRVVSGFGTAPLPPVAGDDLAGIGRTNDAILYGAQTTLWVRGDDRSLEAIGPQTPSCASRDYGRPFGEVFARYEHDFYKIDPLLFSPAVVTFVNLDTGNSFHYGKLAPEVLKESFGQK